VPGPDWCSFIQNGTDCKSRNACEQAGDGVASSVAIKPIADRLVPTWDSASKVQRSNVAGLPNSGEHAHYGRRIVAASEQSCGAHMAARLYPDRVVQSPKLFQELPLALGRSPRLPCFRMSAPAPRAAQKRTFRIGSDVPIASP